MVILNATATTVEARHTIGMVSLDSIITSLVEPVVERRAVGRIIIPLFSNAGEERCERDGGMGSQAVLGSIRSVTLRNGMHIEEGHDLAATTQRKG